MSYLQKFAISFAVGFFGGLVLFTAFPQLINYLPF